MIYYTDCISASTSTKKCWEDEPSAGVFPLTLLAIIHPRRWMHKPWDIPAQQFDPLKASL